LTSLREIIFKEVSALSKDEKQIPDSALEALARCLLPAIRSYFESEAGQREFAEWQARRDTDKSTGGEVKSDAQVMRTA
jgi:hypothetical protein